MMIDNKPFVLYVGAIFMYRCSECHKMYVKLATTDEISCDCTEELKKEFHKEEALAGLI